MQIIPLILDIAAAATILITAVKCFRAGFAATVFAVAACVASILIASILAPPAADYIYTEKIEPVAVQAISTEVNAKFDNGYADFKNYIVSLPQKEQKDAIEKIMTQFGPLAGVNPEKLLDKAVKGDGTIDVGNSAADFATGIIKPVAIIPLKLLIFSIFFAIINVISRLIVRLLKKANRLPVIGGVNRLAGLVLGALCGCTVVFAAAALTSGIIGVTGNKNNLLNYDTVASSHIFSIFYETITGMQ